jgi:TolA-binding protein
MERIYQRLDELNLTEEQLPQNYQKLINQLDARIEDLNETIDKLEADGLTEEQIDEQTAEEDAEIEAIEGELVGLIDEYYVSITRKNQQGQGMASGGQVPPQNLGKQPEKEKKGGDGWMIFGALALVVTLGAVNMFKK